MKNKAIVITGSNGATARELISYFSRTFDIVIGITRHPTISYTNKNVNIIQADISNTKYIIDLTDKIKLNHTSISCWVNCAGGFDMGFSVDEDQDNWGKMYKMNFQTCLNGCRIALKLMKQQGYGRIINMGSLAAVDGFPNAAPYLISKSSVHALTKYIAIETSGSDITCNAILPGIIDTPSNRISMPDEDFSSWENPADIAKKIEGMINSDITGQLIQVS